MKSKFRIAATWPSRTTHIAGLCSLIFAGPLSADTGIWTSTESGNWSDPELWASGTVADGAGSTANFSTIDPTADVVVTLDTARTLGSLVFGDTTIVDSAAGWTLAGTDTNTLTLATTPTIAVNALGTGKSVEISAPLAGTAGFTKQAVGRLLLTGDNSLLSGTITLIKAGGTVAIHSAAALGSASVNMPETNSPGTAFELIGSGADITLSNAVRIAGSGPSGTGALRNITGNNVLSNFGFSHDKAGGRIYVEGGSSLRIQNSFVNGPGGYGIRFTGTGTLILDADNSTALPLRDVRFGTGTDAGPVIQVGHNNSLGTGMVYFDINSNSTLQSKDATAHTFGNALTFKSTSATLGASATGDLAFTGAVTLTTNLQMTVHNTATFSNSISQDVSGRSLTKTGSGKLVLGGANTYSGETIVDQGELILNGSLSASQVSVRTGGTLGGNGTMSLDCTVDAGAVLSPGDASSATLAFGNTLALAADSTYAVGITGTTSHDKVSVTGTTTVNGKIAVTLDGYAPASGDEFQIIIAASISGTPTFDFASASLGDGLTWDTTSFTTDGKIKVTGSANDYTVWVAASSFDIGDDKTPTGDPDGDGMSNQQEYAFGLDPKDSSSLNPITQLLTKQAGTLTYTRRAKTGLTYKIWTSTNLADWTRDATASQSATAIPSTPNESVQVTLTTVPTAPNLFVRVSAE